MNHKTTKQYMKHLKVELLTSEKNIVAPDWKESNTTLTFNKLYFILEGEGVIYIGDQKFYPKPGDIVFIPQGIPQGFNTISPKVFTKYWCHFHANIGTTPLCDYVVFPLIKQVEDINYVKSLFDRMTNHFGDDNGFSPIIANSTLMELLHHYLSNLCHDDIKLNQKVSSSKIHTLISYMEDHICDKLLVKDFATMMNLHPNYLIRMFNQTFGTSPMEYFNRLKIEKAKELLELNNSSISSIADSLGFSNPYYFSTVFKKQTGYSPRNYRNLKI